MGNQNAPQSVQNVFFPSKLRGFDYIPIMRLLRRYAVVLLLAFAAASLGQDDSQVNSHEIQQWLQEAAKAKTRGSFARQIDALTRAAQGLQASDNHAEYIATLVRRAEAYLALGHHTAAIEDLLVARETAELKGVNVPRETILASLGNAYFAGGRRDEAHETLRMAVRLARQTSDGRVLAAALNNLANLLADQGHEEQARAAYREAIGLARRSSDHMLAAKATINAARLEQRAGNAGEARKLIVEALGLLEMLPDDHDKAFALISIARLVQGESGTHKRKSQDTALAYRTLSNALDIAAGLGDLRSVSYAHGYLGRLYQQGGRYEDALQLTRRAIFAAQQIDAPELLYLWYWQTGRLLHAQGKVGAAIHAYRRAVYYLKPIRDDLLVTYQGGRSDFRRTVGSLYLELADLLLRHASQLNDPVKIETYLVDARLAVEQLKTAELQDYFLDECVAVAQSRATGLDRLAPRTAVLYPILLSDRTELLLSLPAGIKQFTIPASTQTVTAEVRQFRHYLEKRTTREYLLPARQLYDWLVRPLERELRRNKIETLIIVPDGSLRTIPMAALEDGERFLVEKYAVATTPGLTLTDARPLSRDAPRLLLNGLTTSVQGFPPLPGVSTELREIQALFESPDRTLLENQDFVLTNVERELTERPYSIVHIASHGQFASDVRNSFLLTYSEKMTMDRLEEYMQVRRFSEEPIELLTLSACQTAAGDDRAALGLAGIAIKAGARSALATLWFINDEASSLLVADFYRHLQLPQNTKAEALQDAQLSMLKDPRYQHPSYWSPFLLIGNWL